MKKIFVVFLVLLCTSVSAVAQPLTKSDIQSLEVKLTKLQDTATDMDKRITEIDKRLTRLEVTVTEMDKRLSNQIAALDTFVRWAIGFLMLVVLAVIALPQVFGYLRDKKEREELQKRVEQLEKEFAQLRTRIIAP
jgi:septal ring factor EnvC (AmiA/AmiB activator)